MAGPGSATRSTCDLPRVLVVDDDADSAEVMSLMLARSGCETRIAYAFEDALTQAHAFEPQIALIDIGLPDIDGHELLTVLKADPTFAECHFVAVTGHSHSDLVRQGKADGFHAYLRKPVSMDALDDLLRRSASVASRTG